MSDFTGKENALQPFILIEPKWSDQFLNLTIYIGTMGVSSQSPLL
jgi:hypothetical protein